MITVLAHGDPRHARRPPGLTEPAASVGSAAWWVLLGVVVVVLVLGIRDVVQRRHALLCMYPLIGHMRYLLEKIRPELQQYFNLATARPTISATTRDSRRTAAGPAPAPAAR